MGPAFVLEKFQIRPVKDTVYTRYLEEYREAEGVYFSN